MKRRNFVSGVLKSAVLAGTAYGGGLFAESRSAHSLSILEGDLKISDEEFWEQVRNLYDLPPGLLYLNNGGCSATPASVFRAETHYRETARVAPSFYLWRSQYQERELARVALADFLSCSHEEIALLRSTTEALITVIQGLDLPEGSEILTTSMDYPTVVHSLQMYAKRRGWKLRTIDLQGPLGDQQAILQRIRERISPETRFMLISDVLYGTGERMPVRQICQMIAGTDILVAVDGAHTVGQFPVNLEEYGCHFFASSLHKWLSAPIGTGLLWVKKSQIRSLWPMYGPVEGEEDNIRKFEHLGTRPIASDLAIRSAIDLTLQIGTERKLARLQYLTRYWWDQICDLNGIEPMTHLESRDRYGAIAAFRCPQRKDLLLDHWLLQKKRQIITRMRDEKGIYFRVSPHIYTLPRDLDIFVKSVKEYLS